MTFSHLIRKAIQDWQTWRLKRSVSRFMPEVIEGQKQIAALKMKHKSTKVVVRRQREAMHAALGYTRRAG